MQTISFFIAVAGPSIVARVELSGLSEDEVSTQANLTKLDYNLYSDPSSNTDIRRSYQRPAN